MWSGPRNTFCANTCVARMASRSHSIAVEISPIPVERAAAQSEYLARIASSLEELRARLEGDPATGR